MRHLRILLPLLMFSVFSPATPAAVNNSYTNNSDLPLRKLIKLSPRSFSKLTGQEMNLKQLVAFRLLRPAMRKAVRKNQHVTLKQFLASNQQAGQRRNVLIILLLLILFGFFVFVINFQDKL